MIKNVFRFKVIQLETFPETFWTFQVMDSDGKYCAGGILMQLVVFV
jgi:hypothetical protein